MRYIYFLIFTIFLFSCNKSDNSVNPITTESWNSYYSKNFNDTVSGSKTLDLGTLSLTLCDSVMTKVIATYVKPDYNGNPVLFQVKSDSTSIMSINASNFPALDSLNTWILLDTVISAKVAQDFKVTYTDLSSLNLVIIKKIEIWKKY